MKRVAWGIVVGGAVAAAFAGSATANADSASWVPDYSVDNAKLFLGPDQTSAAWELPDTSFTHGTGADAVTLTGTDYITKSAGGFNDQFITNTGAMYEQDQLGGGFTNLFYDDGAGHIVDTMKTPFGNVDLSSLGTSLLPGAFDATTSPAAPVGDAFIGAALGLYKDADATWTGGDDHDALTALQAPDSSSLIWSAPATFTSNGADATTLTGTEYILSPTNTEFIDKAGDVFDQHLLSGGIFGVDNLYYDPVNGPAVDVLHSAFGNFDISPLASWFAPTVDVSDLTAASPVSDLTDAGLYSALDLGLPTP
ncbi:hypothetical protein KIH27_04365 [Mycobacterium sp. M1]|uniref:PEP-CTERM sorting domain-containing protein n=1 Tax=Mycolicibacter acidiphilus TaxID=2835306 RepID=A0ABS5RH84_9MYCO|nr:hypothetical protein [Mycolicibacter acidiphilus]MBS9532821.1 hypothetical protein [Mycolicibacter acidiphilus]